MYDGLMFSVEYVLVMCVCYVLFVCGLCVGCVGYMMVVCWLCVSCCVGCLLALMVCMLIVWRFCVVCTFAV